MFRIVEGPVPAGSHGRIDLLVKLDEETGIVVASWDKVGVNTRMPARVRRVGGLGQPVEEAYHEALAVARAADVPLCVIDRQDLFPRGKRPSSEEASDEA